MARRSKLFIKLCFGLFFLFFTLFLLSCSNSQDDSNQNFDFEFMSDSELFDFVFKNIRSTNADITSISQRNDSEIAKLLIASRDSCKVFKLMNDTLAKTTVENNQLFLDDAPLTHERLISLIEFFYKQHGFFVPEGNGVLIMGGEQSYDYLGSGKGILSSDNFILIDTLVKHKNGFWADNARTFLIGNLTKQKIKQFNAVFDSVKFTEDLFVAGMKTQEIPPLIFEFFQDLDFNSSDDFGLRHDPGHGVSSRSHDSPAISVLHNDVLKERMVLTTELGLYYEDKGGVRLENTGVITDVGFVPFCNFPLENLIA